MVFGGTRIPIFLALAWLVSLLTMSAWPLVAASPLFAFDDPEATFTPGLAIFTVSAVCYPCLPLREGAGSFIAFRKDGRKLAYPFAVVALLPLIVFVVVWA